MKKLFSIALVAGLTVCSLAKGQQLPGGQGYFLSTPTHANIDTAVNTTAVTQSFTLPGYWDVVSVQSTFTKISGTVAGTASLYGSNDNVGLSLIGSAQTLTNVATQTFSWAIQPSLFRYYQLVVTPTGTMSVKFISPILYRRRPPVR